MALTITNIRRDVQGSRRTVYCDITFDASYPTGGELLKPTDAGLGLIRFDSVTANPVGGRNFPYDHVNQKLMAFASTVQVADTTDLSAVKTQVKIEGA